MDRVYKTLDRIEKCVQNVNWKTEGKGQLDRYRRRWQDNIKLMLKNKI
jgi:hypothetical protein